ncbi:MAG: plastocyanin/azurin family copper-binding protein [Cyanobacteria bacterium P01_F01_bin.150]
MLNRSLSVFFQRIIIAAIVVLIGSCGASTISETTAPVSDEPIVLTGNEIIVTMGDGGELLYDPEELSVNVGDTVVWDNMSGAHDVVFRKVPEGVDVESISRTTLARDAGPAHSVTFEAPGDYSYYCTPHKELGMTGKITVS